MYSKKLRRGDIVSVKLPVISQKRGKLPAAIVISSDWYNDSRGDVILLPIISSQLKMREDYQLTQVDRKFSGLPDSSIVKLGKVLTLSKKFIKKTGRRLPDETIKKIIRKFSNTVLATW
jgi:mRNA-degrading endonuclease toxin of MazEF toxin-antitoxin module